MIAATTTSSHSTHLMTARRTVLFGILSDASQFVGKSLSSRCRLVFSSRRNWRSSSDCEPLSGSLTDDLAVSATQTFVSPSEFVAEALSSRLTKVQPANLSVVYCDWRFNSQGCNKGLVWRPLIVYSTVSVIGCILAWQSSLICFFGQHRKTERRTRA